MMNINITKIIIINMIILITVIDFYTINEEYKNNKSEHKNIGENNNDSIDIYFILKREVLNNMEGNKRNYLLNSKKEILFLNMNN